MRESFRKTMKIVQIANGYSDEYIVDKMGETTNYIIRIENSVKKLSPDKFSKYAEICNLEPCQLALLVLAYDGFKEGVTDLEKHQSILQATLELLSDNKQLQMEEEITKVKNNEKVCSLIKRN